MKEYRGLAIADYFIKKCLESNIQVTNMAILKMIYFAHGLAYAKINRKLIKDPFYAWEWGPVERKTYDTFKKYGSGNITSPSGNTREEVHEIEKDTDVKALLDALVPLASVNPFVLSEKSHEPGGPWDATTPYSVIDDKLIKVFFSAKYGRTN